MKKSKAALTLFSLVFSLAGVTGSLYFIARDSDLRRKALAWWTGADLMGTEGTLLQELPNDCGPTALKMILDHFDIPSSLEELTHLSNLSTNGTSMLTLKKIAENKGLHVEGWHFSFEDYQKAPVPNLAWVNPYHFIVVTDVSVDGRVEVFDPSIGHLKYSRSNFQKIWSGNVLVFSTRGATSTTKSRKP
ncbi:MAG: cysteine peptidase family C39 domain-containing protein [Acidobacteriia bacterium]|nr:cysteine peptidase family C39 domain-containing protein [Terriglobia bacterium]